MSAPAFVHHHSVCVQTADMLRDFLRLVMHVPLRYCPIDTCGLISMGCRGMVVASAPCKSIDGFAALQIESFGSQSGKTSKPIVVADCGQLS